MEEKEKKHGGTFFVWFGEGRETEGRGLGLKTFPGSLL